MAHLLRWCLSVAAALSLLAFCSVLAAGVVARIKGRVVLYETADCCFDVAVRPTGVKFWIHCRSYPIGPQNGPSSRAPDFAAWERRWRANDRVLALPGLEFHRSALIDSDRRRSTYVGHSRNLTISWWLLLTLTASLPLLWFALAFHRMKQRRRQRIGLCPCCGYDLRATPTCCPECGATTASASEPLSLTRDL